MLRRATRGGLDETQHGRMHAVDAGRERGVTAIHGEAVLRQIVGADREEIGDSRDLVGQHRRGGRLDHRAELRHRDIQLAAQFIEPPANLLELGHIRDHRQQDAHRRPDGEQRPQLHVEQVGTKQAGTNAAQAERRILFRRHW